MHRLQKVVKRPLNLLVSLSPEFILNFFWMISDSSESRFVVHFRSLYLKKYCKDIGESVFIGKCTSIKNCENLIIGSDVSIHAYTYIDAYGGIEIKDDVSIANHCTLIASDHTWSDDNKPIKFNKVRKKPIIIENDVWIASGVRVLGNVKIGSRSIVGAGAIVNKNIENNTINVGVPTRVVRYINKKGV